MKYHLSTSEGQTRGPVLRLQRLRGAGLPSSPPGYNTLYCCCQVDWISVVWGGLGGYVLVQVKKCKVVQRIGR